MAAFLRGLDASFGRRPAAVLVVSGHWEAARPTFNLSPLPQLLFDYYGFPAHTYQLHYPVAGAPTLAVEAGALLSDAGFVADVDGTRGLDHGVFVPFMLIYPEADVPILQLSLVRGLNPAEHLSIGRALVPLRDHDVLIVGSGMSYHNLPEMMSRRRDRAAEDFDAWLGAAMIDPQRRDESLRHWHDAPGAVASHPTPEHLIPLMVAAGAASGKPGTRIYADHVLGKPLSGFRFG